MIALATFIIALLLAIEALEPTGGWLVSLAVLSGIELGNGRSLGGAWLGQRKRSWVGGQGRYMIGLTVFVIALLLAIHKLEPTAPWLVTLAVLSGMEAFGPRRVGSRWHFPRRLRGWVGGPWSEEYDW